MGHWTKKDATEFVRRMSPDDMEAKTGEVHTDASGDAVSNANWNYQDPNGKALFDAGLEQQYWTPDGLGSVREMTQPEKDAVDSARDAQNILDVHAELTAKVDIPATSGDPLPVETRAHIQGPNQRINYALNRIEEILATLEDIRTSTGGAENIRAAIPPQHPQQATQNPLVTPANYSLIQNQQLPEAVQKWKDHVNNGEVDIS
jgi:hypothetical protein